MEEKISLKKKSDVFERLPAGLILGFAGGFFNAYTFVARGGVFCNAQTGNLILMALGLAEGRGMSALKYLVPVFFFILASFLGEAALRLAVRTAEKKGLAAGEEKFLYRSAVLLAETAILTAVGFIPVSFPTLLPNALISSAAALQFHAFRDMNGVSLSTVFCEQFEGKQLHYRVKNPEIFEGKNIVICGGGDSALDWCLNLVGKAESVVLVHRREGFRAAPASVSKMKELCDNWEMQFEVGQVTGFTEENGQMTEVKVTGADGVTRRIPAEHLLVFFGLQPKLGPIADWGLTLERKQIVVDTARFETNIPGVFAVGDINIYPGKKKLILSGFHECALAAFAASEYVYPEKRVLLQYTTTSPKLHKVLGVETPHFD